MVLNKNTGSIFVGTNFEYMVRNASLSSLVFTGIATEMGVESSARHALNPGFLPVIAKEAVSSSDRDAHLRSLANMGKLMPVLSKQGISTPIYRYIQADCAIPAIDGERNAFCTRNAITRILCEGRLTN
jgi:hypothetical protein